MWVCYRAFDFLVAWFKCIQGWQWLQVITAWWPEWNEFDGSLSGSEWAGAASHKPSPQWMLLRNLVGYFSILAKDCVDHGTLMLRCNLICRVCEGSCQCCYPQCPWPMGKLKTSFSMALNPVPFTSTKTHRKRLLWTVDFIFLVMNVPTKIKRSIISLG